MKLVEWAFDYRTPAWVGFLAIIAGASIFIALCGVTGVAFAYGYWVIPVLIWIVAPIWLIVRAYRAARKGGEQ